MKFPSDLLSELQEGMCTVCCESKVVCLTTDIPKVDNPEVELEIDRQGEELLIRNIVLDEPENPLYLEYYADATFVEGISQEAKIVIYFVDRNGEVLRTLNVQLSREVLRLLRREVGLGG
ncbi:MAG: hypothetical protein RXS23_02615 [Metallosphaera yellowstonensis]|nr:hypothetical protein [Metallosphaera yellowstonensis]